MFLIADNKFILTTIHTRLLGIGNQISRIRPLRVHTTKAIHAEITAVTTVRARNTGGYRPGNFPHMAASPQGTPTARANWKTITKDVPKAVDYSSDDRNVHSVLS